MSHACLCKVFAMQPSARPPATPGLRHHQPSRQELSGVINPKQAGPGRTLHVGRACRLRMLTELEPRLHTVHTAQCSNALSHPNSIALSAGIYIGFNRYFCGRGSVVSRALPSFTMVITMLCLKLLFRNMYTLLGSINSHVMTEKLDLIPRHTLARPFLSALATSSSLTPTSPPSESLPPSLPPLSPSLLCSRGDRSYIT